MTFLVLRIQSVSLDFNRVYKFHRNKLNDFLQIKRKCELIEYSEDIDLFPE